MNPSQKNTLKEILEFIKTIIFIVFLVVIIRATVVEPYKIPSGSMIPTLKIHDHIFVSKLSYGLRLPFVTNVVIRWGIPKRGDVVVFTRPDEVRTESEDESDINLIKRVIALSGETVEVRDSSVFINDQLLAEPYARWIDGGRVEGEFPKTTVPDKHVFLLGDNRDQSKDSRFWDYPFVHIDRIKGEAQIIYFTFDPEFFGRIFKVIR